MVTASLLEKNSARRVQKAMLGVCRRLRPERTEHAFSSQLHAAAEHCFAAALLLAGSYFAFFLVSVSEWNWDSAVLIRGSRRHAEMKSRAWFSVRRWAGI